jgi:RNA polymerase sigma factor (sigma-70 family)
MRDDLTRVVRQLRRVVGCRCDGGLDDAQLLQRFAAERDEAAFEVLVWRHGPMVLGVGLRVLHNADDAEDVLQATFLALTRQAPSIARGGALPGWLYRVAYRTALRARRQRVKRPAGQAALDELPAPSPRADDPCRDLWPVLDEELQHLPDKYRTPLVLSYLQGLTNREVAERLGCPPGTVFTRLARGRELLRKRLNRRGVTLSSGLLGAALVGSATSPPLRAALVHATVRAALRFAAGSGTVASVVSPNVVALTEGVLQMIGPSRLRIVWAALVVLAVAGPGAALLARGRTAGERENAAQLAEAADQRAEAAQRLPKEALRYGGKTFADWALVLQIDLKPESRAEAIKALSTFGANGYGREATTAIVEVMRGYDLDAGDEDDTKVMHAARLGIGKIGVGAVPVLVDELKIGGPKRRRFALRGLGQVGRAAKDAVPEVTPALQDQDAKVRTEAIRALSVIDHRESSVAAVAAALADTDRQVRSQAIHALTQWGWTARAAAPQLLVAAGKAPDAGERLSALGLLRFIKPSARMVVPTLRELLKDANPDIRRETAGYLVELGADASDAVPDLLAALKKADNSAERCWMIDALGAIGPAAKAAASVLTEIEKDKHNPDSSQAAARALRRINR